MKNKTWARTGNLYLKQKIHNLKRLNKNKGRYPKFVTKTQLMAEMERNEKGQFVKGVEKNEAWEKAMEKRKGENHPMWKGGHPRDKGEMIECACGCGEMINKYGTDRRERKYKIGHTRNGVELSEETKEKIRKSNEYDDRSKLKKQNRRNDSAYKAWRKKVYRRDNWECKINNEDCSGDIQAHHILNWSNHPELRYEVNNGITLCQAHHPQKRAKEKRMIPLFRELLSASSE